MAKELTKARLGARRSPRLAFKGLVGSGRTTLCLLLVRIQGIPTHALAAGAISQARECGETRDCEEKEGQRQGKGEPQPCRGIGLGCCATPLLWFVSCSFGMSATRRNPPPPRPCGAIGRELSSLETRWPPPWQRPQSGKRFRRRLGVSRCCHPPLPQRGQCLCTR